MTRQEASEIFHMIATVYDLHPEREQEQAPLWIQALEPLRLDDVMPFVQQFLRGKGPEKFPNLVQFVGMVRKHVTREDHQHVPQLPTAETPATPVWAVAWEILCDRHRQAARAAGMEVRDYPGDFPVLPEQEGGFYQLGLTWPPEGRRLIDADSDEYRELMQEAASRPQTPRQQFKERPSECLVCGDTGQVEIGYTMNVTADGIRRGSEQIAPCPACDRGKLMEHPLDRAGPWGSDGFWRGQQWKPVRTGVVEVTS